MSARPSNAAAEPLPPAPGSVPRWGAGRFDVDADPALLDALHEDMRRHAGDWMAAPCWRLPAARERVGMGELLGDWSGTYGHTLLDEQLRSGVAPLPRDVLDRGMAYIHALDHAGRFAGTDLAGLAAAGWRLFDLSSAIDDLLITAFDGWADGAAVLEVGGGFGRLTDYVLRTGRRFRWVNVDAVPASLAYCHAYLARHWPGLRLQVFLGDEASRAALADEPDLLLVPAWHAQALLAGRRFDLCLNVESFQEMDQALVDRYLSMFDDHAADGALVYLMNARNYLFKGDYRYPSRWECLLRHDTVRAWSGDQPVEVLRVGRRDGTAVARIREYFYQRELDHARQDPRRRTRRHG